MVIAGVSLIKSKKPRKTRTGFWGSAEKSPKKHPKKSKNTQKGPKIVFFFYFIFGGFSADPPKFLKAVLEIFFCDFGPEGQQTSGRKGSLRVGVSLGSFSQWAS